MKLEESDSVADVNIAFSSSSIYLMNWSWFALLLAALVPVVRSSIRQTLLSTVSSRLQGRDLVLGSEEDVSNCEDRDHFVGLVR